MKCCHRGAASRCSGRRTVLASRSAFSLPSNSMPTWLGGLHHMRQYISSSHESYTSLHRFNLHHHLLFAYQILCYSINVQRKKKVGSVSLSKAPTPYRYTHNRVSGSRSIPKYW